MTICNSCSTAITSRSLSISCNDCKLPWHAKCQKLTKEDVAFYNDEGSYWRCHKCSAEKRASLRIDNKINDDNTNLSDIKGIILQLKDSFEMFKKETGNNFDLINKKINVIDKIITDNQNMKTQINTLESKIEFLERRMINNEIVIDGVPENKLENCYEIVKNIGTQLNIKITDPMINDCHRVGRTQNNLTRRIVVGFTSHQDKVKILDSRKIIRNLSTKNIGMEPEVSIYIRENLTSKSSFLFKQARDFRNQYNYKFVWTKNGQIFLRKNESEKIINVANEEVIHNLKSNSTHLK
ncbi:uncharacterized protein LOC126554543 [Aphis gossypii]|uniref:uncharacterized protein LOC126554543 n=1 Tax=Aphis gossypii TaxID=80765 RepID=UPI0021598C56|nr:uncharacterized protein LOC126554543 [Aphis gossypii]